MKKNMAVNIILIALEVIALVHDIAVFGIGMFQYYTIGSNVLQMIVSACIVVCLLKHADENIPGGLCVLHLICEVCLTITFLIALLVLAPQEGFAYYFLQDVAPINHFLGPVLSVLSFIALEKPAVLPRYAVWAPMGATLVYGVIALVLNGAYVLDGPYFFLKIHETAPSVVAMWFGIISVLCMALSAVYLQLRKRAGKP